LLLEQLAHEFHGCLIAPSLDQQIEDLAFVVDRAPLLAGVSQTITNPDTLNAVRDETILGGRRAFERLCETARLEAQAARQGHQM